MHLTPLLFFTFLVGLCRMTRAVEVKPGEPCFRACQWLLQALQFSDTDPSTPAYIRSCQSRLKITSLYLCLDHYCTEDDPTEPLADYNVTCHSYTNATLPPVSIIANYTEDDIERLRRVNDGDAKNGITLDEVVLPEEHFFALSYDTIVTGINERAYHVSYGMVMYYFWAVVVAFGLLARLLPFLWRFLPTFQPRDWVALADSEANSAEPPRSRRRSSLLGLPYLWARRFITVPATFGYRCSQNIAWCTIPPRIHSLTITAFIIINIVLCCISYHVFEGNLYWPDIHTQLLRYVSDRTGVISFANFPLIWLFGTRNNVLMYVTGWGFGTYNSFHRWIARVSTVQAVVHSIGYTIMVWERGGWEIFKAYWFIKYWWMGELATIFMCFISIFSVYGLRKHYYEVFLILHIVLSVLVLVGMWYHVEIFHGEYNGYIWPCVVVWILDRILRLGRILSFDPKFWKTKAVVSYDPNSNIIRLTVPHTNSYFKPQPGAYYYLYTFNDFRIWENHPFTLGYATTEEQTLPPGSPSSSGTFTPTPRVPSPPIPEEAVRDSIELSEEEVQLLVPRVSVPPSSLVFLIRPYDGYTSRLRDSAALGPVDLHVLVEGPYGEAQNLQTFESILFIVGGTGITMPLSYLNRLLAEDSQTKAIHIVWAVREHDFLADVVNRDFRGALESDRVSLDTYITRDTVDKDESLAQRGIKVLRIFDGRPDVQREVEKAAQEAVNGNLAVVTCGPGQMADDARRAVVRVLEKGWSGVEYFEESFKW